MSEAIVQQEALPPALELLKRSAMMLILLGPVVYDTWLHIKKKG